LKQKCGLKSTHTFQDLSLDSMVYFKITELTKELIAAFGFLEQEFEL